MLTIEIDSSPFAYKCKGVMNYIEENSSFHVGPQKNDEVIVSSGKASAPYFSLFKGIINGSELP